MEAKRCGIRNSSIRNCSRRVRLSWWKCLFGSRENERFRIEQVTKWVYRPLAQFARSIRAALTQLVETIRRTGTRVQVADNLPSFRVNTTWVTQALYNLIANALKFHRPGEAPEIDLAPTG